MKLKEVVCNFGTVEVISKAANWGTLPLIAIFTEPAKYGQAVLIYAFITIYSTLIMFGQGRSILKFYNVKEGQWVVSGVSILMIFSAMLMLASTFFISVGSDPALLIAVSLLLAVYGLLSLKVRALDDFKLFALLRLPYVLFRLAFAFTVLVFIGDITLYIYAELLAVVCAFIVSHGLVRSTAKEVKSISVNQVNILIGVGFPLFLNGLSTLVISNVDKILLSKYWGAAIVGQYAFLFALTSSITFIYAFFAIKYELLIYRSKDIVEAKLYANKFAKRSLLCGLAFLPICLLVYFISTVLNNKIDFNLSLFGILFIGQLFYGVSLKFSYTLTFLNKNLYILISGVASAVLNILGNFYFLPSYGLLAAASVSSLSFFVMAVLMAVFCQLKHEYAKV